METEPKRPAHELVFEKYIAAMQEESESNIHTAYVNGVVVTVLLDILTRTAIPDEYLQEAFLKLSVFKDTDGGYLADKPAFLRNIDQLLANLAPKD